MKKNKLFYDLLRVALGMQDVLPRIPTELEWERLFDMAVKQSLAGICFVGLQNLGADADGGYSYIGMSEDLYFEWLGIAAQIQNKNMVVTNQCAKLQRKLIDDGFNNCVLKGQGIGTLYNTLSEFRQSGDIDLWLDASIDSVVPYVLSQRPVKIYDIKHVEYDVFENTSVELHYQPSIMRTPRFRRRMAAFSESMKCWDNYVNAGSHQLSVPTTAFNLVYVLQHIYGHLFENGMNLRQFMDYYMVLIQADKEGTDKVAAFNVLKSIGMEKFTRAAMWLIQEVFGAYDELLVCDPDEKEGQYLLELVMNKRDRKKWAYGSLERFIKEMFKQMSFSIHIMSHYPSEAFWAPLWLVYHFFWKRTHRFGLE